MWYGNQISILKVCNGTGRTRQEPELFQSRNLLCYTRERAKSEEKKSSNTKQPLFISSVSVSLKSFFSLRCTIGILHHDLTHHPTLPSQPNHATSSDVATPQTTSLSLQIILPPLHYTSALSPHVSQHLCLSVTPVSSVHANQFLRIIPTYHS